MKLKTKTGNIMQKNSSNIKSKKLLSCKKTLSRLCIFSKRMIIFLIFYSQSISGVEWKSGEKIEDQKAVVMTVKEIIKSKNVKNEGEKRKDTDVEPSTVEGNLTFNAADFEDSGMVPPDAMGVVGPSQFILAANGRIRSFDKNTGKRDQAIDLGMNDFFSPVSGGGATSDSRIRYDRFSDRWFVMILSWSVDPVRVMLAVSDKGVITQDTKWSYYHLEPRKEMIPDYPTIGIDKQAVYIGVNTMLKTGHYETSDGIVLQKESLLKGVLKGWLFKDLVVTRNFTGPTTPQGVDNYDEEAPEGFFIGMDGLSQKLMLRRIKDPAGTAMISDNISIPVSNAHWPLQVPQPGSLNTKKFMLQGFDNRLCSPHIRNNFLYTGYNVAIDNIGNDTSSDPTRDGCKWIEINLKDPEHPAITQTGILYQPSKENDKEERYYWMPGIMTNGLQTLMICCSTAGDKDFADAAYAMRFSNDPPGTLRKPHLFTKSHVVYTLGTAPFENLRWGEYSHSSVDPLDNMTFWDIAEYSLAWNSWGLQVVRIPAPPPATIVKVIQTAIEGQKEKIGLTIQGQRENGSAFYDPGAGFAKRLKVEIEGAKVESIKWLSPTQIDLIVIPETWDKEERLIKVINPDGQSIDYRAKI